MNIRTGGEEAEYKLLFPPKGCGKVPLFTNGITIGMRIKARKEDVNKGKKNKEKGRKMKDQKTIHSEYKAEKSKNKGIKGNPLICVLFGPRQTVFKVNNSFRKLH